jgi:hypothetical protein
MIELVSPDQEPITPFVKKVKSIYQEKDVSSIIVVGGWGDFFDAADHVIMMNNYKCFDVTEHAREIAGKWTSILTGSITSALPFGTITQRFPKGNAFIPNYKVATRSKNLISYGSTDLDLSGLEQIIGQSQTVNCTNLANDS